MSDTTRDALKAQIELLIRACADGAVNEKERDRVLTDVLAWQSTQIPALQRLAASRAATRVAESLDAYPGIPTDLFRAIRISTFDNRFDTKIFRTSGTTQGTRGEHAFRDLTLYDLAAETAARYALFPDVKRMRLVVLAPSATELADSSLSYMLSRFHDWFGTAKDVVVIRNGELSMSLLADTLADVARTNEPIALLGTSFAFVHADDAFGNTRFALPKGSRIMQTGGFKGRSRYIPPEEMRAMLSSRYGVEDSFIIAEYGMTELSSQMYETTLRDALYSDAVTPRRLWIPGWVRATPVHAETCAAVPRGEKGILRIDDAANLDSVAAIQTSDIAVTSENGVVVLGRDPTAVPRGCSLAMDIALSDGGSLG